MLTERTGANSTATGRERTPVIHPVTRWRLPRWRRALWGVASAMSLGDGMVLGVRSLPVAVLFLLACSGGSSAGAGGSGTGAGVTGTGTGGDAHVTYPDI